MLYLLKKFKTRISNKYSFEKSLKQNSRQQHRTKPRENKYFYELFPRDAYFLNIS